ncbi:hypothetical protein KC331_g12614 [Hortaea werneckii]|uniref:Uncharacterized protein n=1 Tax=Hortaea werneckii TaxID=91943 RepID=A0A3M7DFU2_HORWE|nr:hypothetical protein KC331_g12614 [Hortaea werneckii]KAI7703653.1 hypothetical protein KC353_g13989 [Hortaea werneckii]RMY63060.1 hypothetical protein D0865_00110 [Hortaea werneckii]
MVFDQQSGLVYNETIIPSSAATCHCKAANSSDGKALLKKTRNAHGARSMQDMVLLHLARNLDALTVEAVQASPPGLVEKLWRMIRDRRLLSLSIWQIFLHSSIAHDVPKEKFWRWGCEACFSTRLPATLRAADSPSLLWLTHLAILNPQIKPEDLVKVPLLTNVCSIRVMVSRRPEQGFTDRVFRSWADAAMTQGAFPCLQALLVQFPGGSVPRDHGHITHRSLTYLHRFPALELFALFDPWLEDRCGRAGKRVGSFVSERGQFSDYIRSARGDLRPLSTDVSDFWPEILQWYTDSTHHRSWGQPESDIEHHDNDPDRLIPERPAELFLEVQSEARPVHPPLKNVVAFERDWTPWVPTQGEVEPLMKPGEMRKPTGEPSAKKMKTNGAKAGAMEELLGDF